MSKFCQNLYFYFGYRLSYNHPNKVIPIVKEPLEIGLQMYGRDKEQIVALMLPNMGLKVSSGSSWVCSVLGVVMVFWP